MNEITEIIIDADYHIQRRVGPGLLKSLYEVILAHALNRRVGMGDRFSLRLCAFA